MSGIGTSRQILRCSGMSEVGVDRKWLAEGQNGANDPSQTLTGVGEAFKITPIGALEPRGRQ